MLRREPHEVHKPQMEGSLLPEGSGDEESPEEPGREALDKIAEGWYHRSVRRFEEATERARHGRPKRGLRGYTVKNCEEASGNR